MENTMLSLRKKRFVEHFHDNHHRLSPEGALILIVQRRSRIYYEELAMDEFKVTIGRFSVKLQQSCWRRVRSIPLSGLVWGKGYILRNGKGSLQKVILE